LNEAFATGGDPHDARPRRADDGNVRLGLLLSVVARRQHPSGRHPNVVGAPITPGRIDGGRHACAEQQIQQQNAQDQRQHGGMLLAARNAVKEALCAPGRTQGAETEGYERVREIVADARSAERVVLMNMQLIPLDAG
jgi:hypothetical protein